MPNSERRSKRKAEELAAASSKIKKLSSCGFTINEKKTHNDDELVVLESESVAHNLNDDELVVLESESVAHNLNDDELVVLESESVAHNLNDGELVVLESESVAHNLNETSRSSINVETLQFDYVGTGEQNNNSDNTCETFPDDLSKSKQHEPTQPKLSVYPWRFYGNDKTLKRRFQTSFIRNIRG